MPGPVLGRCTRESTGRTASPNTAARSSTAHASRSASLVRAAMSSPYRPNDSRTSWVSPPTPHLRDDRVIALARSGSPLATSTPEHSGNGVSAGTASATTADDALVIRLAAAAAFGATSRSRPAAGAAGTATTTASALQRAPVSSVNTHPDGSRSSRVTAAWTQRSRLRATSSSMST